VTHACIDDPAIVTLAMPTSIVTRMPWRRAPRRRRSLTNRETEILRLLVQGLTRREIAHELTLSPHTVRHHLEHIYAKVGVGTRGAAAVYAVEHDLLGQADAPGSGQQVELIPARL
jgi:DNA-binding CsgD family transcriptional regulator